MTAKDASTLDSDMGDFFCRHAFNYHIKSFSLHISTFNLCAYIQFYYWENS